MASHSGLLACSYEVLNIIFGEPSLSKKDLESLRLTCKEVHSTATREFAKRYLAEPFVVLSRDSLQSLVDICGASDLRSSDPIYRLLGHHSAYRKLEETHDVCEWTAHSYAR
ncbi:unnamed protein product [Aureobasidium vineae]|uniref:F-box domain-containing protein n=1 Tax=Aureobasidium vineae TaxID=2773715 RepID=A0A9N8P4M3_9PEZI|nr:unnamed protein product [Aureobasidium vineae]